MANMSNFMAVKGDSGDVLGKILYFSLANILIEKPVLEQLCQTMDLPYSKGGRLNEADAFRSATGDIRDRKTQGSSIFKIYCRDNEKSSQIISRELVKEELGESTNQYVKLANLWMDRQTNQMGYDNLAVDSLVDPWDYCQKAVELFGLYKRCATRKQVEGLTDIFLSRMEALPISIHGKLFFVPRTHMQEVTLFEDFIESLNANNQNSGQLIVNSMYVLDDQKQRDKMAQEFYIAMRREVELYQERVKHFIDTDITSPAVMNRWIAKIEALEEKRRHYEGILRRQLDDLNDEFSTLQMFSQDLQVRVQRQERQQKAA